QHGRVGAPDRGGGARGRGRGGRCRSALQPRRRPRRGPRRPRPGLPDRAVARLLGGRRLPPLSRWRAHRYQRRQGPRVPGVARDLMRRSGALPALLLLVAGCSTERIDTTLGLSPPEIDRAATFAAYRTTSGLAIVRVEGGSNGTIDAIGWSGFAPAFRVQVGGRPLGGLRLPSPARVDARSADGASAGMVDPSWEDGAIRLTIRPATGPTLHTHSFRRVDVTSGLGVLSRNMQSTLD